VSEESIYKRIGEEIKKSILIEKTERNQKLPSENDLVKQFHVSRTTIQRALHYLEEQGIIYKKKGKGSFVNISHAEIKIFNFSGLSEYVSRMGKEVKNKILSQTIYESAGEFFMKLERVRGMEDGKEIFWLTKDISILNLSLLPGIDKYDFEKESLYHVIRQDYGIYPQYAKLKTEAIISETKHKEYFNLQKDTALVQVVGTVLDGAGNVVEEVLIIYNPMVNFNFLISV